MNSERSHHDLLDAWAAGEDYWTQLNQRDQESVIEVSVNGQPQKVIPYRTQEGDWFGAMVQDSRKRQTNLLRLDAAEVLTRIEELRAQRQI